eukprot:3284011-Pyramimonas_sp.AAC.2
MHEAVLGWRVAASAGHRGIKGLYDIREPRGFALVLTTLLLVDVRALTVPAVEHRHHATLVVA